MDYKIQSGIIKNRITPGQNNIKQMTRQEVLNILANLASWTRKESSSWIELFAKSRLNESNIWTEASISKRLKELEDDINALKASLEFSKFEDSKGAIND